MNFQIGNIRYTKVRIKRSSDNATHDFDIHDEKFAEKVEAFCNGADGYISGIIK